MLTTTPHYNIVEEEVQKQHLRWKVWGICKMSRYNGITVLHIPQKKFNNTFLRLLGFVYWHFISFFVGLYIGHVDIIISPSPPLTIGLLNVLFAKLKHCKTIYNIQEVYPDILKLKDGLVLSVLKWMEKKVYNRSDAVTIIDKLYYDVISSRMKDPSKLRIIPNFVDTKLYHRIDWKQILNQSTFPQSDSIKLLYAGNIGLAQSWETLVYLADRTRDLNVEYIIIGDGVKRGFLEDEVRNRDLKKVHIMPYISRDLMPAVISYSDASFIFMKPEMDGCGFPSKVYTIMACEKPLLILSSEHTPLFNFMKDIGCAKLVTETDYDKQIEEMTIWLSNVSKQELALMGEKGLSVIEANYTTEKVTDLYVALVGEVIGAM